MASVNKLNISSRIINNRIAYEIVFDIKRLYADFAVANHSSVEDREILGFLKDGGLRYKTPSEMHKIADCIVHANGHGFRLDDKIVELREPFKNEFHNRVAKSLTRK